MTLVLQKNCCKFFFEKLTERQESHEELAHTRAEEVEDINENTNKLDIVKSDEQKERFRKFNGETFLGKRNKRNNNERRGRKSCVWL